MSTPARHTIARNVLRLRKERGWDQAEAVRRLAAQGINWSAATWSAMERSPETGRTQAFTADQIAALAATFGVTPNDLFDPCSFVVCPRCGGTGRVPSPDAEVTS